MQLVEERAPHGFIRIGDVISREELVFHRRFVRRRPRVLI